MERQNTSNEVAIIAILHLKKQTFCPGLFDIGTSSSIMAAKKIDVSFNENYAILRMKSGENRLNPEFLREFNCALDEIERYLSGLVYVRSLLDVHRKFYVIKQSLLNC